MDIASTPIPAPHLPSTPLTSAGAGSSSLRTNRRGGQVSLHVDITCPLGRVRIADPFNCQHSPFANGGHVRGNLSLRTHNSGIFTVLPNVIRGINCSGHSNVFMALHRNSVAVDCYRLSGITIHGKSIISTRAVIKVANGAKHDAKRRLRVAYGLGKEYMGPVIMVRRVHELKVS